MDKLLAKLDELFAKYQVSEEEIKEVADIINGIDGELNMDGDEFQKPEIAGEDDGEDEYAEED
jgi:hypothetical protein